MARNSALELDGLDAQGLLRTAVGSMMIGDVVETDRGSGTVTAIHEDRSITASLGGRIHRCLQRDCKILTPARAVLPRTELRLRRMEVFDWSGRTQVSAGGTLEKVVCRTSFALPMEATSVEIRRGTLQVKGQDQDWGGTCAACVDVRLKSESFDEFTAAKIIYDHNKNRTGQYQVGFNIGLGLKATSPVTVELWVTTPGWPGWSAHVSKAKLDIEVEETLSVMDPPDLWKNIRLSERVAIDLLWRRCGAEGSCSNAVSNNLMSDGVGEGSGAVSAAVCNVVCNPSVLQGCKDGASVNGKIPISPDRPRAEGTSSSVESQILEVSWLGHMEVDLSHLSISGMERQGIDGKATVASLTEQKTDGKAVARRLLIDLGRWHGLSGDQTRTSPSFRRFWKMGRQCRMAPGRSTLVVQLAMTFWP